MADVRSLTWAEPSPEPMEWLFPTALESFASCPKRLGFQRDERFKHWSRSGTRAGLGRTAHRLTELVHSGEAPSDGRRGWLERQWGVLLAEEHDRLKASWNHSQVPSPKDWPGETATRVRLLRTLENVKVSANAHPRPTSGSPVPTKVPRSGTSAGAAPLPWIERALFDADTQLAGIPDRVEKRLGVLRVVDLKSGVWQREISAAQRRQLMIYAHLVRATLGALPQELVVVDTRGRESCIEVEASEVDRHVQLARETFAGFNAAAVSACLPANATPETCGGCPFRVVCSTYWMSRDDTWGTVDVQGVVRDVLADSIVIRDHSDPGRKIRVVGTERQTVRIGDEVVALDLERAGPGAGRLRWWSRVRSSASCTE